MTLRVRSGRSRSRLPATVGRTNPIWLKNGDGSPECPLDQRADDAVSLCFDTEPLAEPLAFFGTPVVTLEVASDRPVAQVSARLSEVRADGAVALVSFGILNLTHDEAHERVTPLVPGAPVAVRLRLNDNAHRFAAGSRIRVAVATGLWPIAWPAPEPVTLTVTTGRSTLTLPVRPDRAEDAALRELPPAACTPLAPRTALRPAAPVVARMEEDLATGELAFVHVEDGGTTRLDDERMDLRQPHPAAFRHPPRRPAKRERRARGRGRVRAHRRARHPDPNLDADDLGRGELPRPRPPRGRRGRPAGVLPDVARSNPARRRLTVLGRFRADGAELLSRRG